LAALLSRGQFCSQPIQHAADHIRLPNDGSELVLVTVGESHANGQLKGQLARRSGGRVQEVEKFSIAAPAAPFGDVASDSNGSAPHLGGHPETLFRRKGRGESVDVHGERARLLRHS